ncbi:MAG: transketolase C-terminal domain-containing protein, partial [Christensenellaceae bacterium]
DEILIDVGAMNLPVTFCIDRGGLSGADGETHQGIYDLSYLSLVPNLTVFVPKDREELARGLEASLSFNRPLAIRYPRESKTVFDGTDFAWGKWEILHHGEGKTAILAAGERMLSLAYRVKTRINEIGKDVTIVNARFVKPIDTALLDAIEAENLITLEDNALVGGFGEKVKAYCFDTGRAVYSFGYRDTFIPHGSVHELMEEFGLNEDEIFTCIVNGESHE